jgi:hypothetical protein
MFIVSSVFLEVFWCIHTFFQYSILGATRKGFCLPNYGPKSVDLKMERYPVGLS